jgi:hypothetical protein
VSTFDPLAPTKRYADFESAIPNSSTNVSERLLRFKHDFCMPTRHSLSVKYYVSWSWIADYLSYTTSSYPTDVPFPELDTFPDTLFPSRSPPLRIRAALVTTSETSTRLKDMRHLVSRAIEIDTREALLNDLAELGEAYEAGWQSSSDSGDDE